MTSRQLEIYDNGNILKYDANKFSDEFVNVGVINH